MPLKHFEFWYCFYFELCRGEQKYTIMLLVLRAVRVSSWPWVSEQGNEGSWGRLGLQFCMMPRWQQHCTRPVCKSNAWAPLLDAPHEARPWGGCNQLLLLPCTSVLLVLSFLFFKHRNHCLGDWTLWARHFNLLLSTKLICCICLTNLSLCPFSSECTVFLCTLVFYFLDMKNASSIVG